jgi:putative ABC transport system permease protein
MFQDVRQALRQMAAHPAFTVVTVLTLAFGIGANTAIFSVARGVLLRPLPYAHRDALVHLVPRAGSSHDELGYPVPEVFDYRDQMKTLAQLMEYHSMAFSLIGHGDPDRVQTGVVSANFFRAFGITPLIGRDFRQDDDRIGADPVLMLTHDYWQQHFGGDPGIVGQRLRMNNRTILVIGVLPPLPSYPGKDRVFMPTSSCPFRSSERFRTSRALRLVGLWGQLKPGTTVDQARADVATVAARIQQGFPATAIAGMTVGVAPVREELVGSFRPTLMILLGAVGVVLLLACANAANLTFARLLSREKEVVVRAALGASRARLVRQLLTESVLASLAGGVLGCLLAVFGLDLLVAFANRFTPRAAEIRIDGLVLLFSLALSLATGLASGWLPAVQALRHDLAIALKEGSGRSTGNAGQRRFRDLMVGAQVWLSLLLLIGAGLMIRSLVRLLEVDPGFRPEQVLTATIELPFSKYITGDQVAGFHRRLLGDLAGDASVVSAAVASDVPLDAGLPTTPSFRVEGQPTPPGQPAPRADFHVCSEDYFRTLGIALREGRGFERRDDKAAPKVIIINQDMAKTWWPNRSAIGQRVGLDVPAGDQWRTVVGVVGNVRHEGLAAAARPTIYAPFLQFPGGGTQVFVRTRRDPAAFLTDLRALVRAIDRDQPVADVRTLDQVYSSNLAPTRVTAGLLSLFAALALVITAIGIGAAVSFSVGERVKEMAIRMAIGADRGNVLLLLFRRAMGPVCIGLAAGLVSAFVLTFVLTRLLSGVLFGIQANDPLALSGALLVLLAIGVVTCLVPARRATKVDPATTLRA